MFNLSFESLTSREALQRLRDVQRNEPDLWALISTRQYQLQVSEQRGVQVVDSNEEPAFSGDTVDGSDVAVDAVLQHIADGSQGPPTGYSIDHDGALIPHNESEVYELEVCELEVVESAQAIPEKHHFGRGKRRRTANTLYDAFWSH